MIHRDRLPRARRVPVAAAALALLAACAGAELPETAPVMADAPAHSIVAGDGALLPYREWLPAASPKAVVLGLHGFNDYSKAYDTLGRFLAERGIATYAYDQRGFGAAPRRSYWPGVDALLGDVAAAAGFVRARHPGTPLYCMGESLGGAVVMAAAAQPGAPAHCDGVILSAPAVWGRQTLPWPPRALLAIATAIAPDSILRGETIRIKPSDNVAALRALATDPLVLKGARVSALDGLVDMTSRAYDAADRIDVPALYLYGGRDTLVPRVATVPVLRRMRGRATLAWYPNGYHLLFRDLDAAVVENDIASWIVDRRAPLPSGGDRYAERMLDVLAAAP